MKISTQRWIDRWIGQLLCGLVSMSVKVSESMGLARKPSGASPKNILVILLSEMGSIVLAGPMFKALHDRYPGATLHVLQLKRNQEVAKLLQLAHPDNFHSLNDRSGFELLTDIWRVIRAMRRLPLDVVIDCELFSRISSLMAFGVGAPLRVGFTPHTQEGLYRGGHINRAIPYNPYQHISKQFLSLVDAVGDDAAQAIPRNKSAAIRGIPIDTELGVDFSAAELAAYRQKMAADFAVAQGHKLVLLYAGGGLLPERAWPAAHYARVARGLCDAGHAVGLIGLREDADLAKDLQRQVDSGLCLDLTGYTQSIRELLMLFHNADLLITNDGGPGHFASLTPIKTFAFFGPETARLYGPIGSRHGPRPVTFESGIACSPCLSAYNHRQTFCDGDNQCLKRIAPDPVLADALAALAR